MKVRKGEGKGYWNLPDEIRTRDRLLFFIQENQLDLTNINEITASVVSASSFYGDGSGLTGITASPAGSDTQIQFNKAGVLAGDVSLTYVSGTGLYVTGAIAINSGDDGLLLSGSGVTALLNITYDEATTTTPSLYVTASDVGIYTNSP